MTQMKFNYLGFTTILWPLLFIIGNTNTLPDQLLSCDLTVEAGPDQVECEPGESVTLSGTVLGDALFVQWLPEAGLSAPDEPITQAIVDTTTTFTFIAAGLQDQNLISNGDFSNGPVGFTSDYQDVTGDGVGSLNPSGTFAVDSDPRNNHRRFARCQDHSPNDDRMMIVNGSGNPDNVWCQTIAVNPNTDYAFSAWATTLIEQNPAQLQFSINGVLLGDIFRSSGVNCTWEQFYAVWSSEATVAAEICIANVNATDVGNDFAIDDIAFQEICLFQDTMRVDVLSLEAEWDGPIEWCQNQPASALNDWLLTNSTEPGVWLIDGVTSDSLNPSTLTPGPHSIVFEANQAGCTAGFEVSINIIESLNVGVPEQPEIGFCVGIDTTLELHDLILGEDLGGAWTVTGPQPLALVGSTLSIDQSIVPGIYTVSYAHLTSLACAEIGAVFLLNIVELPNAEAGETVALDCLDGIVSIGSGGAVDGVSYLWTSDGNQAIMSPNDVVTEVDQPGTYYLTATNILGCQAMDSVVVNSNQSTLEAFATVIPISCDDPAKGTSIRIDSVVGGVQPYEYSTNGVDFGPESEFRGIAPGTYEFVVRDANFCETTVAATVIAPNLLEINLEVAAPGARVEIPLGDSIQLDLQINQSLASLVNINWEPVVNDCDFCLNPIVKPTQTTTYSVTVEDESGCVITDQITIEVSASGLFYIPDVFSPNNDGVNDRLVVYTGDHVAQINQFSILDRWGNRVYFAENFSGSDINRFWDGKADQQLVPPGVYVFFVEMELVSGEKAFQQGAVTLVY